MSGFGIETFSGMNIFWPFKLVVMSSGSRVSLVVSVVSSVLDYLFPFLGEREVGEIQQKKRPKPDYRRQKRALILKYGNPTYNLVLKEQNLNEEIIIFGKTRRIMIQGKLFSHSDILSCTYTDNQRILKGEATFLGKLDTRKMPSFRGFEGDTNLAAYFEGNNVSNKEIITHNYTVIIKLRDPSASVLKIPMGSNWEKVNELLEAIKFFISG